MITADRLQECDLPPDAVLSIGGGANVVAAFRGSRLVWSAFGYRSRWKHLAACRGMPVETFMVVPDELDAATAAALTELCSSCPVHLRCLSYGRASGSSGWWGGELLWYGVAQPKRRRRRLAKAMTVSEAPMRRRRYQRRNRGVSALSDDDVAEIRRRYALGGVRQTELAAEFGVRPQTISDVIRGSAYVARGYRNANKTHCKWGHEFTPENTFVKPNGSRDCIECRKRRNAEQTIRRRRRGDA